MDTLSQFVGCLILTIQQWGYLGLVVMMAIESSFIPLPSELILPPAGYLFFTGQMNFVLIILSGVLGSILGALFNYWLGFRYGKKAIVALLRFFHMKGERYDSAERFFRKHGAVSTFVGRLLLGIRHFISFPAGVAKMNLKSFIFYTGLGAAIWSIILTALGYYVGKNQELLHIYYREIGIGLFIFCLLVVGGYVWWQRRKSSK